jgi:hypothetical protein
MFVRWIGPGVVYRRWCADMMSVSGGQPRMAAPHRSGGAVVIVVTAAEHRRGSPLRPRRTAVPSDWPLPQASGGQGRRWCGAGSGAGPHTPGWCDGGRLLRRQSGCPSNPSGAGRPGRGAHRGAPRRRHTGRGARARPAHAAGCPVRPQAHPRCSVRPACAGPEHRPCGACAGHRRRAPVEAPGWGGLVLWQACAPSAPGLCGRGEWSASTRRRLRRPPWRGAWPRCLPAVPQRVPAEAVAHGSRRPDAATSGPRGQRAIVWRSSSRTRRRSVPLPGTGCRRWRGLAAWCLAVGRLARASARRSASSSGMRAKATAMGCCTAASATRSAPPARVAVAARLVPSSGRCDGRLGWWPCAPRAARVRSRGRRRRRRARGARLAAGSTDAGGSIHPGAAWRSCAHRACRVWRCRRASPA